MSFTVSQRVLAGAIHALRNLFRRDAGPEDPYARVRVPKRKGPGSLSAAVALKEPDE